MYMGSLDFWKNLANEKRAVGFWSSPRLRCGLWAVAGKRKQADSMAGSTTRSSAMPLLAAPGTVQHVRGGAGASAACFIPTREIVADSRRCSFRTPPKTSNRPLP